MDTGRTQTRSRYRWVPQPGPTVALARGWRRVAPTRSETAVLTHQGSAKAPRKVRRALGLGSDSQQRPEAMARSWAQTGVQASDSSDTRSPSVTGLRRSAGPANHAAARRARGGLM